MQKRLKCREPVRHRSFCACDWDLSQSLAFLGRLFLGCGLGAMLLAGCMLERQRPNIPQAEAKPLEQQPVAKVAVQPKQARHQALIEALLAQANAALADQRLTLPIHDNAYDRFQAVLILDPANEPAAAGLQTVLLRYAELARAAARSGRIGEARELVERAADYYPDNPLLQELAGEIVSAEERARRQLQRLSEQDLRGEEFVLPAHELSRRSQAIIDLLAKVAERVQETDESVLIMARTDAEGRWIYKQINEAAEDYRVRGDIRLTSTPKLRFMPPL